MNSSNCSSKQWSGRTLTGSVLAVVLAVFASPDASSAPPSTQPANLTFIIVAPKAFHAELADYIAHKRRQMTVELVALEMVLSRGEGVDDPERLKRFLFDAWKRRGLRYALLVGDADVLPVRYMVLDRVTPPAFDYAFYPSDLYYADLAKPDGSFESWNGRDDGFHAGYFGEVRGEKNKKDPINFDQIDYRPDIALGCWPASTVQQVRTIAAKSIAYENSLSRPSPATQTGGTNHDTRNVDPRLAAFIAVGGWVDARQTMDGLAARLPDGWTARKSYYRDKEQAAGPPPPTEKTIVALLNEGARLMLHAGHGSDDSWAECLSVASLPKLHNAARPAILLSAGCSTARFATLPPYEAYTDIDGREHKGTNSGEVFAAPPPPPAPYQKGPHNPTGLGEQLLRAGPDGAVAYFGCNTGSQPCGLTLLAGFIESLHDHPRARLGDCWADAVAYYWDHEHLATITPTEDWYPASIFFQGMKFMLFGDPTLPMPGR